MLRRFLLLPLALIPVLGWFYWDARLPSLPLTAWQLDHYLNEDQPAHRIEAALRQLQGSHPALARLRKYHDVGVRSEVARLAPSVEQLEDPSAWIRFRVALSLEATEPLAVRPVLLAAMRPTAVFAAEGGTLRWRLAEGAKVDAGDELGSVGGSRVRAPLPGRLTRRYVQNGEEIRPGQRLADVTLADKWVIAALEALGRVGLPIDIEELHQLRSERFPDDVKKAADTAITLIEARPKKL